MHYPLGNHELLLIERFLDPGAADQLLEQLSAALPWRQDRITIFGREHPIPREQCWIADEGMTYRYSGQTLTPVPWPEWLRPHAERVSEAAGETFNSVEVINSMNHTPSVDMTTVEIPNKADYAGEYIRVRFLGLWGEGDYWLDIDNVNIRRCESITVDSTITNTTGVAAADGGINLLPTNSEGPFTYEWDTGDSTRVVTGLLPGGYTVTITDSFGCQDDKTFTVDIASSVIELDNIGSINLAPNPTTGLSTLEVAFKRPVDARIQVLNTMGQLLYEARDEQVTTGTYPIDLNRYDSGLYLIRIFAEGQVKTAKLIKTGF